MFNNLQNLEISELIYIQQNSPVSSKLWNEASSMLAAHQETMQKQTENYKYNQDLNDLLGK